jgi:hypothetical protein
MADEYKLGWAAWLWGDSGPPVLLKSPATSFIPTDPYGVAVKAKLANTPALPMQ